jgi:hypothetical protein
MEGGPSDAVVAGDEDGSVAAGAALDEDPACRSIRRTRSAISSSRAI